jgi:antitoxin component YwqK of YwqJK toxin-antitoxin module
MFLRPKFFLVIIAILGGISCSRPDLSDPAVRAEILEEAIDEKELLKTKRTVPYSGWIKRLGDTKKPLLLFKLKGMNLHGTAVKWRTDGSLEAIETYIDGIATGRSRQWYPNGQLMLEINVLAGRNEGQCTAWYPNGSLREQGSYKNGLREGLWKHYSEDGELNAEVLFKRGEEVSSK